MTIEIVQAMGPRRRVTVDRRDVANRLMVLPRSMFFGAMILAGDLTDWSRGADIALGVIAVAGMIWTMGKWVEAMRDASSVSANGNYANSGGTDWEPWVPNSWLARVSGYA